MKDTRIYSFNHTELILFDNGNYKGFLLKWSCDGVGFGELAFYDKGGKFSCDTECMSLEFIQQAMAYHLKNNTTLHHI